MTTFQTYAPGHPFHDPREWEGPLNPAAPDDDIQEGDLVQARRGRSTRIGVAVSLNAHGRWVDETGLVLIPKERTGDLWEACVVRSPGPEPMPITPGAVITAVLDSDGDKAPWLILGPDGSWHGQFVTTDDDGEETLASAVWSPDALHAFTDPDGTAWSREDQGSPWREQGAQR